MTLELPPELASNGSFTASLPGFQNFVDSTSLGEFKQCPRKYYYSIIWGYQPISESVHLTFGLLMHEARERYYAAKARGVSHDDALDLTLDWSLRKTWNSALQRGWVSGSPTKNRDTFLRSIIWYLDRYGDNDPLETVILQNGRPAVELSFQFDIGLRVADSPVHLCGHIDRLVRLNSEVYVSDLKTTEKSLGPYYFQSFSPDNQFSLYTLAGKVVFEQPTRGLIIDALQVTSSDTKFQRQQVPRSDASLDEWLEATGDWIGGMESCARRAQWPQNDKACGLYGGCPFRSICARSPDARGMWLRSEFRRRVWDPTQKRGDV